MILDYFNYPPPKRWGLVSPQKCKRLMSPSLTWGYIVGWLTTPQPHRSCLNGHCNQVLDSLSVQIHATYPIIIWPIVAVFTRKTMVFFISVRSFYMTTLWASLWRISWIDSNHLRLRLDGFIFYHLPKLIIRPWYRFVAIPFSHFFCSPTNAR